MFMLRWMICEVNLMLWKDGNFRVWEFDELYSLEVRSTTFFMPVYNL